MLVFTADDLRMLERLARQRAECAKVEQQSRDVVRDLHERGAKPTQLADVLGLTRQTIHNWLK